MTELNKQNCLKVRYAFRDTFDDMRGIPQNIRHREWVKFVKNSTLDSYEKDLAIEEFIPLRRPR